MKVPGVDGMIVCLCQGPDVAAVSFIGQRLYRTVLLSAICCGMCAVDMVAMEQVNPIHIVKNSPDGTTLLIRHKGAKKRIACGCLSWHGQGVHGHAGVKRPADRGSEGPSDAMHS